MSSMSHVTVSFSPTDYFYVTANDLMPTDALCNDPTTDFVIIPDASCVSFPTPSKDFLNEVGNCVAVNTETGNSICDTIGNVSCMQTCLSVIDTNNNNSTTYSSDFPKWKQWHDLSMNCYKKELCKNKENATRINQLQNNHLGSDQNYEDSKAIYTIEYMKTINLGIGVVILLLAIYYSNK